MTHPLHPMVVHFPIALLSTALLFEVLEALLKRDFFREAALWLLGLGTLGAVVAAVTGILQEDTVEAAGVPERALEQHETAAFATIAVFAALLAMRWFRGRRWIPNHPAIFSVLALTGLILLGLTGYLGGGLVYTHGAGVERPLGQAPADRHNP
jgi:uncharacterized membrane protein